MKELLPSKSDIHLTQRLKASTLITGVLFCVFLIARFAGLTFFPELRFFNLLIIVLSLLIVLKNKNVLFASLTPLSSFFVCMVAYTQFTALIIAWLQLDHWFRDFLDFYFAKSFQGSHQDMSVLMLFEGLEFSLLAAVFVYFMKYDFSYKRIYTQ